MNPNIRLLLQIFIRPGLRLGKLAKSSLNQAVHQKFRQQRIRSTSAISLKMPAMSSTQSETASNDFEVVDGALLEQANKILSQYDRDKLQSIATDQLVISDKDAIPPILEIQAAPLEPDSNCDLIAISESNAFSSGRRWFTTDVPSKDDISFAMAKFQKPRLIMFEVSSLVESSCNATLSSEADRLFTRLVHLKATDFKRETSRLKHLLPENYRTVFLTKGIGETIVKECLMKSRSSDDALLTSIWESCRGIVCLNPIDGSVIKQMRQDLIPQGYWQKYKASWWAGWWSTEKKRIARMSTIIDEAEQIEIDYQKISMNAPPRFSLLKTGANDHRLPGKWKDFKTIAEASNELDSGLKKWSVALQTFPIQWHKVASDRARLLSLDGRGVKGISSLLLLQAIMKKVRDLEAPARKMNGSKVIVDNATHHDGRADDDGTADEELSPAKYFDLVGGTSTGGLIGLMLCRLGMSIPQTINAYKDLASEIFAPRIKGYNVQNFPWEGSWIGYWLGNVVLKLKVAACQPQFDGEILEGVVKKTTKAIPDTMAQGKDTTLMEDPVGEGHSKM
jgi:hypothetical protein